jgi:hypothetical protein
VRTTRSKRASALLVLGTLVASLAGIAPSHAQVPGVTLNNLTPFGVNALGSIRVKPVAVVGSGLQPLTGDGSVKQNPNRVLGDVATDCPGVDCRLLGFNGSFQPAWDAHTHYHAGNTRIRITIGAAFLKGDTILIGSPNCNYPFQGLACGTEQAQGEVDYITAITPEGGGSIIADLAFPLAIDHDQGVRVTKYSTPYPGQMLRVEVPDTALNGAGAATVNARAFLLPPGGDPADEDDYYVLPPIPNVCPTLLCEHLVPNTATGTSYFYVDKTLTALFNVGRTFVANTGDDWYSVLIVADKAAFPNNRVADGYWRFKLNPYSFGSIDCDGNGLFESTECVSPAVAFPGTSVSIAGRLVDNSSIAARDRNVESVIVDVTITKPGGDTFIKTDTTCWDSNPSTTSDTCGRRPIFGGPTTAHHGEFFVTIGALQCLNLGGATPGTCAGSPVNWVLADLGHITETIETGTYLVQARPRIVLPIFTLDTQFDVSLAPFL